MPRPKQGEPSAALHVVARQYMGVPFLHQGRDPAVGIDCIGLLALTARAAGLACANEDRNDYSDHPHAGLLESHLERIFGPGQPLTALRPGVFVSLRYGGPVRHVGIVGEIAYGDELHLSLIHTDSIINKVVEHRITADMLDPHRRPCIVAVYVPQVAA